MNEKRKSGPPFACLLACLLSLIPLLASNAKAETYIAGQVGATIPQRLSNISGTENIFYPASPTPTSLFPNASVTDAKLQTSVMYGLKLGHYFDSVRWLGVETEVFNTTTHFERQIVTLSQSALGSFQEDQLGINTRVTTWAFNLVARYPGERLQPYIGAGLGLFFVHITGSGRSGINPAVPGSGVNGPDFSQSSTTTGLNTQLGLRFLVTQHVSMFGEWKFNHTTVEFDQIRSLRDVSADLNIHNLVFGIGYHF